MLPVDGPGISLIAPHERFEASTPVIAPKDASAVSESGAADGAMFEDREIRDRSDSLQRLDAALINAVDVAQLLRRALDALGGTADLCAGAGGIGAIGW